MPGTPRNFRLSYAARASLVYATFAVAWVVLSDRLLIFAVEDQRLIGMLSIWKGVLFVAATALALYAFLRQRLVTVAEAGAPGATRWQVPVAVFAILAAAIIGVGIVVHDSAERATAASVNARLSAIGEIKIDQIASRISDEKEDLEVFARNPLVADEIRAWKRRPRDGRAHRDVLTDILETQRRTHDYRSAVIYDGSDGAVLAAATAAQAPQQPWDKRVPMPRDGEIVLLDFRRSGDGPGAPVHVGVATALYAPGRSGALAVVAFDLDPRTAVFPKLLSWPGSSDSGETLLVERAENSVLFLSPLRFRPDAVPVLRRAGNEADPVVAEALGGKLGLFGGLDYRGVPVLAYAGSVPGTPWILVAKIDEAEAFADLTRLTRLAAGVVSVLLAAAALLAGFWWRGEIHRHSGERLRLQLDEAMVRRRFEALARLAHDVIVLVDAEGRLIDANECALSVYGYAHDAMLALTVRDLCADGGRKSIADILARLGDEAGVLFESEHRRSDGSTFPVEVSARRIDGDDGSSQYMAIIRDISERKLQEEALRASESHFRAYFERSVIGMASTSPHRGWLEVNDRLCEILGYSRSELVTKTWAEISHPDDLAADSAEFYRVLSGELDEYQMDRRFLRPDGSVVYTRFAVRCLRKDDGDIDYLVALVDDISERRRAEERLRIAAQVFDGSAEGIIVTDHKNDVLMVNQAFSAITGYAAGDVIGRNPRLLSSGCHDRVFYEDMWRTLQAQGSWHGEIFNRRKNGDIYPEWLTISLVRDEDGRVVQHIGMFSDVTERKEAAERISFLAQYDVLTGLPNRMLLRDRVGHALAMAARGEEEVAVIFLDLDRFKNINDSLGHSIGDGLLVEAARRLQQCVRGGDTIARIGGDEFILVLPQTGAGGAASVTEKILRLLVQPYNIDNHLLRVTASLGISLYPHDGRDYEELVKNADAAMYAAKAAGRNRYRFYTAEMNRNAAAHLALEIDLRAAVDQEQLVLHYQPQFGLENGRLIGLEALVRWQHPELGMVYPARFIPIAEETGLILEIGNWVLRAACAQQARWRDAGLAIVPVAVNLSAIQFRQESLVESVAALLAESNLPARCLELELTESVLMENAEQAIQIVERLAAMGIRLCIDDFGTGYSSLMYLRRLPVRKLKIDQSFVHELGNGGSDAIVTTIIQLGRNLGIEVIAEGVETAAQRDFLRHKQCAEAQGHFYHRPVAAEAIEALLREPCIHL